MEDPLPLPLILFIILIFLMSGFCSLMENALRSSRKSRLRVLAEGGEKKYREALKAAEESAPILESLRMWIIFLGAAGGLAGGLGIIRPLGLMSGLPPGPWGECLAALVFIGLALLLGDTLPRLVFPPAPQELVAAALPPVRIMILPWKPLLAFSGFFSALVLKPLRRSPGSPAMTGEELKLALREGEKSGIVEKAERAMVENVFYLGDRPVGTFMSHRSEIRWLDSNAGPEEAREAALNPGEQRHFPVAEGSPDRIIGVVSVVDILGSLLRQEPWPGLRAVMKAPQFVPETMSALRAFEAFRRGDVNLILVMDEYGGFAGVLSVRNLIEEIVGQLSRPAPEEEAIIPREDGSWLADGSVNIDEVARLLSLESLAGEHLEYRTLAGFILNLAGEIPRTGADYDYRGYRFTVADMDGNRIDKVLIKALDGGPQSPEGGGSGAERARAASG